MTRINKMAPFIVLLIILLTVEFNKAQIISTKIIHRSKKLKGFNQLLDRTMTNENFVSFNYALNTLLDYPDFEPLVISIGHFGSRRKNHDFVGKYFRERLLKHYQFDLEDFTEKSYILPTKMTWIILVDEFDVLERAINENTNFHNAANRFIVFFIGDRVAEKSDKWIDLFRTFWNRFKNHRVVISSINENFRYIYRYSPFAMANKKYGIVKRLELEEKVCADQENTKDKVATSKGDKKCSSVKNKVTRSKERLFEDFHNMNGYPMRVTVFRSLMMSVSTDKNNMTTYSKLDANVMKLIEKRLNSKFKINVLHHHKNEDPFPVALRTIGTNGKAEFVFTGYFTKLYSGKFHFTSSIFEDNVCLIAPSSGPIPKFYMPFLPFSKELWFLLLTYNFVIAAFWFFIQHFQSNFYDKPDRRPIYDDIVINPSDYVNLKRSQPTSDGHIGFEDYRPSIRRKYSKTRGLSRLKYDRTTSFEEPPKIPIRLVRLFDLSILACSPLVGGKTLTERVFLFGTLLFGVVVIGLYQSNLVSSLSKPIFYPQIDTLNAVAKLNSTIITKYENLKEILSSDESPESENLPNKIEILASNETTMDLVAYRGAIAVGRSSSFKLENFSKYHDPETNRMLLHMVEECPATYSLAYVGRYFSPYLERIDSLLLRTQQAGLIEKWYGDMLRTVKVAASQRKYQRHDKRVKLSLHHLLLTFLGLGIGLFCSTLVFLGEYRFAMKNRSNTNHAIIRHTRTQSTKNTARS